MSSTRSGGPAERPASWRSLYFMVSSSDWLTRQRSILWTTHRMPRMPEGEGGEARGRLSCTRVIPLWRLKDPMVRHIRVPSRGGRRIRVEIESALPCSTADRQARLQQPQGGSISGTSLLESSTAAAAMAESAAVRASSFWLRDRIAEGSCPRGATRVARRACVQQARRPTWRPTS